MHRATFGAFRRFLPGVPPKGGRRRPAGTDRNSIFPPALPLPPRAQNTLFPRLRKCGRMEKSVNAMRFDRKAVSVLERLRRLDRYQKGVLLVLAAMVLVFSVLYPVTLSRRGYAYQDALLLPRQENGGTVYTGSIRGQQAAFAVQGDGTVTFRYGSRSYGPYTVRQDPSALPPDGAADGMTGVELRRDGELLFRGGMLRGSGTVFLYNTDGSLADLGLSISFDGVLTDAAGNEIDGMAPSAATLIDLATGPALTHKGSWAGWFCGVLLCIATAVSILFADELFRWGLRFQIRNAELAEPSEWELASRYIGWTVLPLAALAVFAVGLQ